MKCNSCTFLVGIQIRTIILENFLNVPTNIYTVIQQFCSQVYNPLKYRNIHMGFPGGSDDKESACSAGDPGSIPGSG